MEYIDGFVAAVANENKEKYIQYSRDMASVFKEYGALRLVECWGDDISEGEVTSFPLAVKCEKDETTVFSWIAWPSKEHRDSAWEKLMADPRMSEEENPMPFDGQRMIYGGFQMVVNA